jgi:signal transduction histidine kinase
MHDSYVRGDTSGVLTALRFGDLPPASRTIADYEDRFHAVRSGLAAVSGALHVLLDQDITVEAGARARLESVLMAEVERLQRLVAPAAVSEPMATIEELDLDGVVGDVVLARRMAGQEVAWTPCGTQVRGRGDELVEVLNILLVNAWRHAQGAPARIEVAREGGSVVVNVSDDGPGVLPGLRHSIFERGVHRPGSPGQGLGLAMARDLVEGLGGSLTLSAAPSGGACFCIVLPSVEREAAA